MAWCAAPNGASQTYMALGTTGSGAAANLDVVTVDGGAGNDRIILSGVASATVNAGSGADIVSISMLGAAGVNNYRDHAGHRCRHRPARRRLQRGELDRCGCHGPHRPSDRLRARRSRRQVRDDQLPEFWPDRLHGEQQRFCGRPPRLLQSGSDLLVQVDRDGAGATNGFVTIFAIRAAIRAGSRPSTSTASSAI